MRVLVTAASKHQSTAEIADRIGAVLRAQLAGGDHRVDIRQAAQVRAVDRYDAVVLGSAVYAGHWLPAARDLAISQSAALRTRPVYLFSSGPIGEPPKPTEDPVDAAAVIAATGAREHRVFAGRLDRHRLGFAEKAIVIALRAPDGDFRDWDAIDAWAGSIAAALAPQAVGPAG